MTTADAARGTVFLVDDDPVFRKLPGCQEGIADRLCPCSGQLGKILLSDRFRGQQSIPQFG